MAAPFVAPETVNREGKVVSADAISWTDLSESDEERRWGAAVGRSVLAAGDPLDQDLSRAYLLCWNVKLGAGRLLTALHKRLEIAKSGGPPIIALLQEVAQGGDPSSNGDSRVPSWAEATMAGAKPIELKRRVLAEVVELESRLGAKLHVCYVPSMRNGQGPRECDPLDGAAPRCPGRRPSLGSTASRCDPGASRAQGACTRCVPSPRLRVGRSRATPSGRGARAIDGP